MGEILLIFEERFCKNVKTTTKKQQLTKEIHISLFQRIQLTDGLQLLLTNYVLCHQYMFHTGMEHVPWTTIIIYFQIWFGLGSRQTIH